jgi:hypothetical protein
MKFAALLGNKLGAVMKTELEVRRELRAVRAMLKAKRDAGSEDTETLYSAQQALGWVLGELRSPTELESAIAMCAADLIARDGEEH